MATGNETIKALGTWNAVDPATLTFAGLQAEVGEWSRRNFPNNTPNDPFEGLVEEVGELAHARLKARQGIRGTKEEHEAAEKDAVGDIVIYLADYCERNKLSLSEGTKVYCDRVYSEHLEGNSFADLDVATSLNVDSTGYETASQCFRYLVESVGNMSCCPATSSLRAGAILVDLAAYCNRHLLSLAEIVASTWTLVRQRDWTTNPTNGQVST